MLVTGAVLCLSLVVYHEARSEPLSAQVAVAQVVMERVSEARINGAVCDVVFAGGERPLARCQFSFWCDGKSDVPYDREAWASAQIVATAVLAGYRNLDCLGATHYHADYVNPKWLFMTYVCTAGTHIFYREEIP